jgi:hypothetical protein
MKMVAAADFAGSAAGRNRHRRRGAASRHFSYCLWLAFSCTTDSLGRDLGRTRM